MFNTWKDEHFCPWLFKNVVGVSCKDCVVLKLPILYFLHRNIQLNYCHALICCLLCKHTYFHQTKTYYWSGQYCHLFCYLENPITFLLYLIVCNCFYFICFSPECTSFSNCSQCVNYFIFALFICSIYFFLFLECSIYFSIILLS
jgi:hypothetical protein